MIILLPKSKYETVKHTLPLKCALLIKMEENGHL